MQSTHSQCQNCESHATSWVSSFNLPLSSNTPLALDFCKHYSRGVTSDTETFYESFSCPRNSLTHLREICMLVVSLWRLIKQSDSNEPKFVLLFVYSTLQVIKEYRQGTLKYPTYQQKHISQAHVAELVLLISWTCWHNLTLAQIEPAILASALYDMKISDALDCRCMTLVSDNLVACYPDQITHYWAQSLDAVGQLSLYSSIYHRHRTAGIWIWSWATQVMQSCSG